MSIQPENKPEIKDGHRLEGKHHLNFKLDPEDFAIIEQHQKERGFKNLTDTIRDILRLHNLQPEEKIVEFQNCNFRSEIPAHYGKFVDCKKLGLRITEDKCQKCRYYMIRKVLLMTKEQLERSIKKLREEKQTLTAEVQELKPNAKTEILNKIEWLEKRLKIMADLLKEKNGKISEKDDYIQYIVSLTEPHKNLHRIEDTVKDKEPLQISQQIPAKVVESQRIVERITEKEKEKEKITEKFQQPQESQEPKLASEDFQLECPKTRKEVSFKNVCHVCLDFLTCPSYGEAMALNKALGRQ
jgi:hypothetical protein